MRGHPSGPGPLPGTAYRWVLSASSSFFAFFPAEMLPLCISAGQKQEIFLSISASATPFKFSPAVFCNLTKGEVSDCGTVWKERVQELSKRKKLQGFFSPSLFRSFWCCFLSLPCLFFCSYRSISSSLLLFFFLYHGVQGAALQGEALLLW